VDGWWKEFELCFNESLGGFGIIGLDE